MKRTHIGLPAGYRDLLFDEAAKRRTIEYRLASAFQEKGYSEVMPSLVEYQDLYARGNQAVAERTVKFLDREDHLLALRADFTPAIARLVSSRLSGLPSPIRIWYSGNVFRKVESRRGRYCEFGQVGAELLGDATTDRDVEIISMALEVLDVLGIHGATLHLNHAGVFRGIVEDLRLDRKSLKLVKSAIDRKDARDLTAQLELLGVADQVHDQLAALARCTGGADILERARTAVTQPLASRSIEDLAQIAKRLGPRQDAVLFDLTEIDEMEYYTGVMFTIVHPGLTTELGRGGRYDGLVREFGADLPAVGFSCSLDALMELT